MSDLPTEVVVIVPTSVAVALVAILAYVVKKRDRQRERVSRAHRPRTNDTDRPLDGP